MGLASLGLVIGAFCGFLYSVLLLNAILGLDLLGPTLSRPQPHLGGGAEDELGEAEVAGRELGLAVAEVEVPPTMRFECRESENARGRG
jgi:hypothetical protein